jgi:RimJ/RimL family protein N-acetyltransferase
MAKSVFLAGRKIDLCVLDADGDLSAYASWVNDQETTRFMGAGKVPTTARQLREYIERYAASGEVLLGVFAKDSGAHVGNVTLHLFDKQNRSAEAGIMIGEASARGKGYALEALQLLCRHAFMRLNLNKVTAGVIDGNAASLRLFEKAGFKREGLLREHFYLDGAYKDCVRFGLLKSDFH